MFGRLFDAMDDFDTKKVMEVVNLVWDNREQIMDLIERLPELLPELLLVAAVGTDHNLAPAMSLGFRSMKFLWRQCQRLEIGTLIAVEFV